MLKKLLKYDFHAVFRYWWIILCTQVGVTAASALVLKFVVDTAEKESFGFLRGCGICFLMVAAFAVFLAPLLSSLLCYFRFYKNLFTDEGYLTFTLPVTRRQILLSKTLVTLFFNALDFICVFLCLCVVLLIGLSGAEVTFAELMRSAFESLLQDFGGGWILVLLAGMVALVGSALLNVSAIFLCITLGATVFKKMKVLGAIGIYYLGQMLFQLVTQIFGLFGLVFMLPGIAVVSSNATAGQGAVICSLVVLIVAAAVFAVGFTFYFIMLGIVERKLNLP